MRRLMIWFLAFVVYASVFALAGSTEVGVDQLTRVNGSVSSTHHDRAP